MLTYCNLSKQFANLELLASNPGQALPLREEWDVFAKTDFLIFLVKFKILASLEQKRDIHQFSLELHIDHCSVHMYKVRGQGKLCLEKSVAVSNNARLSIK